jgi:hypothetical protein
MAHRVSLELFFWAYYGGGRGLQIKIGIIQKKEMVVSGHEMSWVVKPHSRFVGVPRLVEPRGGIVS